jgi:hypothetical protein
MIRLKIIPLPSVIPEAYAWRARRSVNLASRVALSTV